WVRLAGRKKPPSKLSMNASLPRWSTNGAKSRWPRAELGARIEALEQELKQKQAEAERSIHAEARRKLDLAKRRKELEHSPSAKIFKKRPENSQGAGKKTTPGRKSPKGDGQ